MYVNGTPSTSQIVSYSLAAQTISNFPSIGTQPVGGPSIGLNAISSSGLAITYSVLSGPAVLSGTNDNILTTTGAGTVVLEATQAGNGTYAPVSETQSFNVTAPTYAGQLYVLNYNNGTAGEYNDATGAAVNTSFVTGLNEPEGAAVSGSNLFITNFIAQTVGEYNAATGAPINTSLVSGLSNPEGIAVSGSTLYVVNTNNGTVGEYNAATGATINASLVTGLSFPDYIVVYGGNIYVGNYYLGTIGEYNAATGAVVNASFITVPNPNGLAIYGGNLYVASAGTDTVGVYNATTGASVNASFITGLSNPQGLVISGSNLYVMNYNTSTIEEYNASTGAVENASLVSGVSNDFGIAADTDEVSNYDIQKEENYDQASSAAPTVDPKHPFQFSANVNPTGASTLLSTSTVTPPGGSALYFESDENGLDYQQNFSSKAALDAAYPAGTYSLTVNSSTPNTYTGTAVLGADNYPPVPQIISLTNATWSGGAIVVTDITQPVTITWNSFNSSTGQVNFNVNNADIGSQFTANGSNNSFTFTPNTSTALENNESYEADLSFSNNNGSNTTNIPGASSGAGYETTVQFIIQTGSPSSGSKGALVFKDNVVTQTSNSAPVNAPLNMGSGDDSSPYGFGCQNSVAGSVTGPGAGSPYVLGFDADSSENKYRYSSGSVAALTGAGGLNTVYPDGTYTVRDGSGNTLATLALTGDVYPNVPQITAVNGLTPTWNAQGQLVLDPSIDNTITWTPFTASNSSYNYTTGGHISAEFEENGDNDAVDIDVESGVYSGNSAPFNTLLIPADTMTAGNSYEGKIEYFLASSGVIVAGTPIASAGYDVENDFIAVASTPSASLTKYTVQKTQVYQQASATPTLSPVGSTPGQPGPFSFRAQGAATGSVTGPGTGSPYALTFSSSNNDDEYSSGALSLLSTLNSTYPDGTYTLSDGNSVALTGDVYPNLPQLLTVNGSPPVWNSSGQLVLDPTIQNTLVWSAFTTTNSSYTFATGGSEKIKISGNQDSVSLTQKASPINGTPTPFNTLVIPPNTFTAGNTYSTYIDYYLASTLTSPSTGVYDSAGYDTQNYFTIAPVFSSSTLNSVIKEVVYQQTTTSAPTTGADPYTFMAFGTSLGSVTGPAGSSVAGPYTLAAGSYTGYEYFGLYYPSVTSLNAAYNDGSYTLADGTAVSLTGDAFPTAPQVTEVNGATPTWNAQGQLVLNPQIANTITWTAYPGSFATGEELFLVNGNQDSVSIDQVAFGPGSGSLAPSSFTTYTIPAGTLTSGNTYTGSIQYYADSAVDQLSSGNYDLAKYETNTGFTILAGVTYTAEKAHILQQTSNSAPADYTGPADEPGPYNFHTFGGSGTTDGPGGDYTLTYSSNDHAYEFFSAGFTSLASLNGTYPDGNYTLTDDAVVALTGDVFPNIIQVTAVNGAPPIWNSSGNLVLDPAIANTLTWTAYTASNSSFTYTTGGSENISIYSNGSEPTPDNVNIDQQAVGPYGEAAFNALTIPASTLTSGNTYTGSFEYALVSAGSVSPAGSALYLTDTYLSIFATGTTPQSFSNFQSINSQVAGNAPITLSATATSGLAVTYSVTGPATLSGAGNNVLSFTGAGQVTLTASVAGNSTYAPASQTQNFNVTGSPPVQQTNTVTILHSSGDGTVANDGLDPNANLIQGSDGFFYGTSSNGGSAGDGAVYEITPAGRVVILHSFGDGSVPSDGLAPKGGLVQGLDGNFYGVTSLGGSSSLGTVYKITPGGAVTILHNFGDGTVNPDGANPYATLVQDTAGNLYGTTQAGGSSSQGTAFEITTQGALTILHNFGSVTNDGLVPNGLIQGTDGNLYGTTQQGGTAGVGTFFEIRQGDIIIIHNFGDGSVTNDADDPTAGVIQGSDGNFYGTSNGGGAAGNGTVFKATVEGAVTILHSFGDGTVPMDGANPFAGLIQDRNGNFYGTTYDAGSNGRGSLFKITPQGILTILHEFGDGSVNNDGASPVAGLVQGADTNFYGTTTAGGAAGEGTVFKLTPGIPELTSASSVSGTASLPFTYQVTTSSLTTGFTATNLPAGLTINALTGLISGTPTTIGTNTVTLTLTGSSGTNSAQVIISIQSLPVPAVTSILYAFGSVGTTLTYTTIATNNATSYTATGLTGTGLTLTASTGVITGNPTTVGTFPVTLTAKNSTGTSAPVTLTIQIFATTPPLSKEYVVLHRFNDGSVADDGQNPFFITQAFDGTYYGTTYLGGNRDDGVFFNMNDQGTTTIVANYSTGGGATPPPVVPEGGIQGSDGNFYFTTEHGGSTTSNGNFGRAFIPINPQGIQSQILHNFNDGSVPNDGSNPQGQPLQGLDGNFYGVTSNGGTAGDGTVYKITPLGVESVFYSFGSAANDGTNPDSSLIQDANGNFYGTTPNGGSAGQGTVFKISPQGVETILHNFGDGSVAKDGAYPAAALVEDSNGNLYGTTPYGGANGTGTVFEVTAQGFTILHSFNDGSVTNDGSNPVAALIQGIDGNFYGTTENGGAGGVGTVFEITSSGTVTIIHNFGDGTTANDGANPAGSLYQDTSGNFYGTTLNGGSGTGYGTAFVIVATQTASHAPVFIGANYASGPIDTPFSFTPKVLYGVSPGGSGTSGVVSEVENFLASFVTDTTTTATSWTLTSGTLPPQLAFNTTSGKISGVPLDPGTYTIVITPNNAMGQGQPETLTFYFDVPPVITSLNAVQANAGTLFTYQILANASPISFGALNLPGWLAVDIPSGQISGTPPGPGSYSFTATASNYAGTGTQQVALTVTQASNLVPTIQSATSASGTAGTPFSYSIVATNSPTGYTAPVLFPGMSFDPVQGIISGTPTTAGTYSIPITATNSYGTTAGTVAVTIAPAPSPVLTGPLMQTATPGTYFMYQIPATGLVGIYNAVGLPFGLTLDPASGIISGTPTRGGQYPIALSAINATGTASATLNLTVGNTLITFTGYQNEYPGIGGPTADPLGDGVPNLLKFLYDIVPTTSMTASDQAAFPKVSIDSTTNPGTEYLTVTYRQNAVASGVSVLLQSSPDLQSWQTVTPDIDQPMSVDPTTGDPIMEMGVKINSPATQFIRLNVSLP